MPEQRSPQPSFVNAMFDEERAGTFLEGYVFRSGLDLELVRANPANGYWNCDIAHHDSLSWSAKVYELFGLPAGSPVGRDWAASRYSQSSRNVLERVRKFGITRDVGFILDAEIEPDHGESRWIRILAVPIVENGRVVAIHGFKRAL